MKPISRRITRPIPETGIAVAPVGCAIEDPNLVERMNARAGELATPQAVSAALVQAYREGMRAHFAMGCMVVDRHFDYIEQHHPLATMPPAPEDAIYVSVMIDGEETVELDETEGKLTGHNFAGWLMPASGDPQPTLWQRLVSFFTT